MLIPAPASNIPAPTDGSSAFVGFGLPDDFVVLLIHLHIPHVLLIIWRGVRAVPDLSSTLIIDLGPQLSLYKSAK
jgi:hypothetical protein